MFDRSYCCRALVAQVKLRVLDNPQSALKAHEWDDVGAVIVQGTTWQFKGWPFAKGEAEIFHKMGESPLPFGEVEGRVVVGTGVRGEGRGLETREAQILVGLDGS